MAGLILERVETEMVNIPSSESLDLHTIRSKIKELEDIHRNCHDDGDSDQLLQDCFLQLQSKIKQIMPDCSNVSIEDLDAFSEHLKDELNMAEAENARISNEIEDLTRTYMEGSSQMESDLELFKCSLDFTSSQDLEKEKGGAHIVCPAYGDNNSNLIHARGDHEFEIFKLHNQIEESKIILKSMQDLDSMVKRFGIIEQIEDALSDLKVIEFDGTCIKLSLRTYIPKLEDLLCEQKIGEGTTEPSDVNHEFLIEVINGTMELKNVEMFPNDVYIGDIIDAAKSFRHLFSQLALMKMRSSLEWFVRKVQDRIIQCTLRRLVVKSANNSRHSFEYLDRDEMVVAHLVGGVDAFIKVFEGWPISRSSLKLVSLKSSDHHSKNFSLSFICKVEEVANSLDVQIRQNLSGFVDAVEKVLIEQMHLDLQYDGTHKI